MGSELRIHFSEYLFLGVRSDLSLIYISGKNLIEIRNPPAVSQTGALTSQTMVTGSLASSGKKDFLLFLGAVSDPASGLERTLAV